MPKISERFPDGSIPLEPFIDRIGDTALLNRELALAVTYWGMDETYCVPFGGSTPAYEKALFDYKQQMLHHKLEGIGFEYQDCLLDMDKRYPCPRRKGLHPIMAIEFVAANYLSPYAKGRPFPETVDLGPDTELICSLMGAIRQVLCMTALLMEKETEYAFRWGWLSPRLAILEQIFFRFLLFNAAQAGNSLGAIEESSAVWCLRMEAALTVMTTLIYQDCLPGPERDIPTRVWGEHVCKLYTSFSDGARQIKMDD